MNSEGFTVRSALIDNGKMAVLYGLGTALLWLLWPPLGLAYLLYSLSSLLIFIATLCPYCYRSTAQSCPSGYHLITARFFPPRPERTFARQFRLNVVLMLPVWFAPPLAGLVLLLTRFSWLALVLLVLFCVVAFVILPYISNQHSCKNCENASQCPWRRGKSLPAS